MSNCCGGSCESSNDKITLTVDEFEEIKGQLVFLDNELSRLLAQPLVYATVVKADNKFNLDVFEVGDRFLVLDKNVKKKKRFYGKATTKPDEEGWVIIEYMNGQQDRLNIGLNGELPQCKLLGKDDGMNVVIALNGQLFEVHGLPGVFFKPTDYVKVDMESKQIHSGVGMSSAGDVVVIKNIVDDEHVEVSLNGTSRIVLYALEEEVKAGQRAMLDSSNTLVLRILPDDNASELSIASKDVNLTWDDIAGLEEAKEKLQDALELPYQHPEIYKFYNMKPPKGILLYGPQGCGKTLCGKAAAATLARMHGAEHFASGFIYCKGPALLNKFVGATEEAIRAMFARGREHYDKHGYPALLFIDEADALLPMRGSGISSDVENTIVPQFLSEMDGLTESGVMVLLATNQPKRLDPAVVREGRVDHHVRIYRPNLKNALSYFQIHMQGLPVMKGHNPEELAQVAVDEIFHEDRVLYRLTHQDRTEIFRLSDAVTGAMIAGVVQQARCTAMKRDIGAKKPKGVTPEDFKASVDKHFRHHQDLNSTFDLEEFCDSLGWERKITKVQKIKV